MAGRPYSWAEGGTPFLSSTLVQSKNGSVRSIQCLWTSSPMAPSSTEKSQCGPVYVSAQVYILSHIPHHRLIYRHCFLQLFHLQGSEYSQSTTSIPDDRKAGFCNTKVEGDEMMLKLSCKKGPLGNLMTQNGFVLAALTIVLLGWFSWHLC